MAVLRYAEADLPTVHGPFRLYVYREVDGDPAAAGGSASASPGPQAERTPGPGAAGAPLDWPREWPLEREHIAIVRGVVEGQEEVLLRVHSECWTSEVIGSLKCDCREQLNAALERIAGEGTGVVVYLRQEGRGIGLGNKIRAYALQNSGADTVEANLALGFEPDARKYDIAGAIVRDLGIRSARLLTNNPLKVQGLRDAGVAVTERVSHWVAENQHNAGYLAVKRRKMGHHPDTLARLRGKALPGKS
jgi:GTP cyclohydrolase II